MRIDSSKEPKRIMFCKSVNGNVDADSLVELLVLPDILGGKPCGYIHKVYTDERHQRKGYATRLMRQALSYAEKIGCHKVFLVCDEKMSPFYEKFGMEKNQIGMVKRFNQITEKTKK